jgi:hypothetical protein
MTRQDSTEFIRAINLSAHGVGIGSFVYLRRILERMIVKRFEELRESERWADEDYKNKSVAERIEMMKEHLPDFMVDNKRLYGILSRGMHELTEEARLGFSEIAISSIRFILLDEHERKQERVRRANVKKAIENYHPPKELTDS